jgi:hypothetical protein
MEIQLAGGSFEKGVRRQKKRGIRGQKTDDRRQTTEDRGKNFGLRISELEMNAFNDLNVLNGFPCWEVIEKSVVRGQLSVAKN